MGGGFMRIAVCDDEITIRASLRKALKASEALPKEATITEFPNGGALVESHKESPYNIIFLDIEMPGISGIEAGRAIRRIDSGAIIIFITNHLEYASESIGMIVPFDYIQKPFDNRRISDALNNAMAQYREQRYLVRISGHETVNVLIASGIVYLESYRGKLCIITEDKRYYCDGSLNDYESRLSGHGFLRCHNTCLINMSYIVSIGKSTITTKLGQSVDMSVRKRKNCLIAYSRYRTWHMV